MESVVEEEGEQLEDRDDRAVDGDVESLAPSLNEERRGDVKKEKNKGKAKKGFKGWF